jgi:DedD protein
MGLLSFRNKKKQDGAHVEPGFESRSNEAPPASRSRGKDRKDHKDHDSKPADPILPEKKRARRRLLGAIALVVAVVIGLPMVLDSEPKPLADDIAIKIPSRDKPSSESAPAAAKTSVTSAPKAASIASTLDAKEDFLPSGNTGLILPALDVKSAGPSRTAPLTQTDKAADEANPVEPKIAELKSAAAVPNAAVLNAVPVTENAANVKAILEAKPDAAAEEKKIEAKKAELKKAELKKAELKKAELKKAEAKAAEAKAAEVKAAAESKAEKVIVQVAALATTEKINEVLAKLKSAGIQSYSQKVTTEAGERTRIRIITANKAEADKMRAKLASIGLGGAVNVPAQ